MFDLAGVPPASWQGVYGMRKLVANYFGPLFKVRRASDSALLDVYPTEVDEFDYDAVVSWSASSTITGETFYDQDEQYDMIAPSTANEPTLKVDTDTGKPSFEYDGSNDRLESDGINFGGEAICSYGGFYSIADTAGNPVGSRSSVTNFGSGFSHLSSRAPFEDISVAPGNARRRMVCTQSLTLDVTYAVLLCFDGTGGSMNGYINGVDKSGTPDGTVPSTVDNNGGTKGKQGSYERLTEHFKGFIYETYYPRYCFSLADSQFIDKSLNSVYNHNP
jgi:hypothetical protein